MQLLVAEVLLFSAIVTESSILDVARDHRSAYVGTHMSMQNVRSLHELSLLGKTNLLFST